MSGSTLFLEPFSTITRPTPPSHLCLRCRVQSSWLKILLQTNKMVSVSSSLKDMNKPGVDNISNKVLKTFLKNLFSYLCSIINSVMRLQYFLCLLKHATDICISRAGNTHRFPLAISWSGFLFLSVRSLRKLYSREWRSLKKLMVFSLTSNTASKRSSVASSNYVVMSRLSLVAWREGGTELPFSQIFGSRSTESGTD